MTQLEHINRLRRAIVTISDKVEAIQAACQHEWKENIIDNGLTMVEVEKRCVNCDAWGGSWQKRREWVRA